ncbi:hypothetical protein [Inediibacterium massiliense]|uniref:hypothetical protein n=1 Tax=Inediibacterium massiliense TaxID=1658111 RepID=UPI0006B52696|nr:hypothetical protein [Inediibacterium massiliense]
MNEDKLIELLSNLDDDLAEKEIDKLLEGVEIDMNSINKKANEKLKNHNKKNNGRKKIKYVAAACIGLLCITTAYADDISEAIKVFFNKTPVYSTMVDGEAYYLKGSYSLNEDIQLKSLMVSEGKLEMELTSSLSEDELEEINIIPKKDPNTVYGVGGYSKEGGAYSFSFMNKNEENYNIKPFKDLEIKIAGKSYEVSLEEAKSLNGKDQIYTSNNNVKGVNVGATKIDENGKLNIQVITAFEDEALKLASLGKPSKTKVVCTTENTGEGILGSGTSSKTDDIYVVDEKNKEYKLEIPKDSKGRPVTIFETNAPKDQKLTLKLPAMIALYEKTIDSFKLNIPKEGEEALNKELDFNIQKAVIKNIKRTSKTSAKLEIELNTGGDESVDIRSFDFYSPDVKKISSEFKGDQGVITLEFDENMDTTDIEISYPEFVMNGNWLVDMK